ncbi:MAG: hypothetical protein U5K51_16280 [Flavobacteriaceae bacterium]|nr:hypothetical protein [Flavobacteriaceae bacterium]
MIYLPKKAILVIGLVLVAGHNLLDHITMEGKGFNSIIWYFLHQRQFVLNLGVFDSVIFAYPVIPWIGLMALGYCFGTLYQKDFGEEKRKKWLLYLGFGTTALFFLIRGINMYGDLVPWSQQKITVYTLLFFNVTKYPPSLVYILITTGPTFICLYLLETIKIRFTEFFLVFGRVPLFFYFLHVFVIHALAIIGILIFGGNWKDMIFDGPDFSPGLLDYGYSLGVVYLVWIFVILILYPFSKKYMQYKANNKDKWWLSYL